MSKIRNLEPDLSASFFCCWALQSAQEQSLLRLRPRYQKAGIRRFRSRCCGAIRGFPRASTGLSSFRRSSLDLRAANHSAATLSSRLLKSVWSDVISSRDAFGLTQALSPSAKTHNARIRPAATISLMFAMSFVRKGSAHLRFLCSKARLEYQLVRNQDSTDAPEVVSNLQRTLPRIVNIVNCSFTLLFLNSC